jgi:hypothetical protein
MTSLLAPGTMPTRQAGDQRRARLHGPDPAVIGIVLHRDADTYLEQCVASLAAQTRPLVAIVVAHLGAAEPPAWICRRAPNVHVLTPSGPASTAAVVEEIVACYPADGYLFQESTDWSAPERLERLLATARAADADLVGSDYVVVFPRVPDARTRMMPPDGNLAFESSTGGTVVEPSTMLVDRSLVERLGGFNTQLTIASGNEFVARAAAAARVVNVSRPLCFTRQHAASDWSSSSAGESLVGRVVVAALGERSRHHAVSLARRQRPDVAMREPRRRVELIHVGGPAPAIELPAVGGEVRPAHIAAEIAPAERPLAAAPHAAPPVFVVAAFESLSRFATCCLAQHPELQSVEVTPWMSEVAQLSARYLEAERRGEFGERSSTAATADAVYRAASTAVDAMFVGGPFTGHVDAGGAATTLRWIGAVAADRVTLTAAAMLYPDAVFLHVARPVDDMVAAQLEVQDDADIEELYNTWLTATHDILDVAQLLDGRRVRTLHYDRLVSDPETAIAECLEGLGHQPAPACTALFVRSGADLPPATRPLLDLAGIPAQHQARRLSLALSGKVSMAPEAERAYLMARILAEPRADTNRRRRATDLNADDRNPYAVSHDLVRRYAGKETIVCVVSKGDEMAVRIRGHSVGWHFPQTEDGAYAGYHPTDAREAIAHLEHLRDRGAQLFLIPKVYVWWLNHYAELRLHLERTYVRVPSSEDEGALFDLRAPRRGPARPSGEN